MRLPVWRLLLAVGVAVTALSLGWLLVHWLPERLASADGLSAKDAAEETGRVRTALLASVAGLIAVTGAVFTGLSYRLNRAGQITERFTRAIDQLGNTALDVRLGGIYALERIARDSADDHQQVVEVLSAFVREHAPWPRVQRPADAVAPGSELLTGLIEAIRALERAATGDPAPATTNSSAASVPTHTVGAPVAPAADIQAALTVLGRRRRGRDATPLDLSRTDLRGAALTEAYLRRASLIQANLRGASLERADLRGALMHAVDLRDAWLSSADLRDAHLDEADLRGAQLDGVTARGARGRRVRLSGARIPVGGLRGADIDDIAPAPP